MSDVIKQTADAFSAKNKTLKVFFFFSLKKETK